MCGVEISDLPCLALGDNLSLTSKDMADLRLQDIAFDDDNDNPYQKNIPIPGNIALTQLEEDNSWRSKGIICPRRSNNLHHANAAFNNYTCE